LVSVLIGTLVGGRVIVRDGTIADGTDVYIVVQEADEQVRLTPDERADLEAGIAEADRGELISEDELFERLDRLG